MFCNWPANTEILLETLSTMVIPRIPRVAVFVVSHRDETCVCSCRAHKLVALLQHERFRASRTHFDPLGIRTDATLRELKELLTKQHSQ